MKRTVTLLLALTVVLAGCAGVSTCDDKRYLCGAANGEFERPSVEREVEMRTGTSSTTDRAENYDRPDRSETKKERSNAYANNGKGGNYGRTGHSDNGKGKGRSKGKKK